MIVLLNGSFGVGKTTVARWLRGRLAGSAIFDPEIVGAVLRLLPRRGVDDYQDLPAWRRLTVAGIKAVRRLHSTVIVPMAVTNLDYLAEIRQGAGDADPDVRHLCLVAPLEVVLQRLSARAAEAGGAPEDWQLRRARECCAVHGGPQFAEQVPAWGRTAEEVAADIAARLADPPRPSPP